MVIALPELGNESSKKGNFDDPSGPKRPSSVTVSSPSRVSDQPSLFSSPSESASTKRDDLNQLALLGLAAIRGVGSVSIRGLFDYFNGDLSRVFLAPQEDLIAALRAVRSPDCEGIAHQVKANGRALVATAKEELRALQAKNVTILFLGEPNYPERLKNLSSPPRFLFVEGDVSALTQAPLVAVVGTREPTEEGMIAARNASVTMAQRGVTIVSGLALGIDAQGHRVALDYGARTVAILGTGINQVFPMGTARLRQEMVAYGGAVVSEYLPNETYSRDKFVARNRIQAALSDAVCIVEGRTRSGTAHTLRFARELSRPVFGVIFDGFRNVPQEELLRDIAADGDQVFEVGQEKGWKALASYIGKVHGKPLRRKQTGPKLYTNVLREAEELTNFYGAMPSELGWLIKRLEELKKNVESERRKSARKGGSD